MGKRKSSPVRLGADDQKHMSWSMADRPGTILEQIEGKECAERLQPAAARAPPTPSKASKFCCSSMTVYQRDRLSLSDKSLILLLSEPPGWCCCLASFQLEVEKAENILLIQKSSVLRLHVGPTIVPFLHIEHESDVEHAHVSISGIADCVLAALFRVDRQRKYFALTASPDKCGSVEVCILAREAAFFENYQFPAQSFSSRLLDHHQFIRLLLQEFYGVACPDSGPLEKCKWQKDTNMPEEFFGELFALRPSVSRDVNVQHAALRPRLRPYQANAVRWMLQREKSPSVVKMSGHFRNEVEFVSSSDVTEDLHCLYEELITSRGQKIYFNRQTGRLMKRRPGRSKQVTQGGILADEMGLGKTVEVLSLVLLHPRTLLPKEEKHVAVSQGVEDEDFDSSLLFACICGDYDTFPQLVRCITCGMHQHPKCVNLHSYLSANQYLCPHCRILAPPIPSCATLIIAPSTICHQWKDEIDRHITHESLSVYVYEGVHKAGFVQPHTLADNDIVITTYENLRRELNYVDLPHCNSAKSGRSLRRPKRFMTVPSPIIAVEWWRICLDEAQMVEGPTKAAQMVLRLTTLNRWCVTGTPIQHDVNDLYGLVLFLGSEPFWVHSWWQHLLYNSYQRGCKSAMLKFMSQIMWRSAKKDVIDQICLPKQSEVVHWLKFSAIESHFYKSQFQKCAGDILPKLARFEDQNIALRDLDKNSLFPLLQPLTRLRQACSHPQAVRGCFSSIGQQRTLTMGELLVSMIRRARHECEEAHRQSTAAQNGVCGLLQLQSEDLRAVEGYRSILRSTEELKEFVRTDSLQKLHTMHQLQKLLQKHPSECAPTTRDSQLPQQIAEIQQKYLCKVELSSAQVRAAWEPLRQSVRSQSAELNGSRSLWWSELLQWADGVGIGDQLIEKIKEDLTEKDTALESAANKRKTIIRQFNTVSGLMFVLHRQLAELQETYSALQEQMASLTGQDLRCLRPSVVNCCLRPMVETKEKCLFCQVDLTFSKYQSCLFFVEERIGDQLQKSETDNFRRHHGQQDRKKNWADSELERALKSALSFIKSYIVQEDWQRAGQLHLKIFETMKKEFKSLRSCWLALHDNVALLDELDMAIEAFRLPLPDDDVNLLPPNVLQAIEIPGQMLKLKSEHMVAQNDLKRRLGQFHYLRHLQKSGDKADENREACPICQQELGVHWGVMQCGHSFCFDCIQIILQRCSFGGHRLSTRCAVCRQPTHHELISYVQVEKDDCETNTLLPVKGDWSTKVEHVVRCLLQIIENDKDAKALVFSPWQVVLGIVSDALNTNNIAHICLQGSQHLSKNLVTFKKESEMRALLLPLHTGANGLNLIEATHVLILEPILNPSQELQAIGRVHRIGQTKPTTVHKFRMRNTVEERLVEILSQQEPTAACGSQDNICMTLSQLSELFTA